MVQLPVNSFLPLVLPLFTFCEQVQYCDGLLGSRDVKMINGDTDMIMEEVNGSQSEWGW